jgi:GNAT superfamily N-acetyltransferase
LKAALNQVFRPAGGDLTAELPLLLDRGNLENLRVIATQEGPVSHAAFCERDAVLWGRRVRVGCLGAVFTLPGHAGKGLASRVVADAVALASRRCDLLMISGERDLYRRLGFDPVPPGTRFAWTKDERPRHDAPFTIARATTADVPALAALHDQSPVRFLRSPETWQRLLLARQVMGWPGEVWLVRANGAPRAYVAVQTPGPRADGSRRPARVLEVAGEPAIVVEAARALAEELILPGYAAAPYVALFAERGLRPSTRQFLISAQLLTADVPVVPWLGLDYV